MKPSKKIEEIKDSLIDLFGENDSAVRAVELKEKYLEIGLAFQQLRDEGRKYETAIKWVCDEYNVSESTAKRAIKFTESLVHENELTSE